MCTHARERIVFVNIYLIKYKHFSSGENCFISFIFNLWVLVRVMEMLSLELPNDVVGEDTFDSHVYMSQQFYGTAFATKLF